MGWLRFATLGLIATLSSPPAWACSVGLGLVAYEPAAKGTAAREPSPPWKPVLAPSVRVVRIQLPTSTVAGNCSAYAYATIEVTMPAESDFAAKDLGFVFRSPVPQDPYLSFPSLPITSKQVSRDGATLTFRFGFEPKNESVPIEVFAINKALQVGPSTTVLVDLKASTMSGSAAD